MKGLWRLEMANMEVQANRTLKTQKISAANVVNAASVVY
jgi:hypothetical protein